MANDPVDQNSNSEATRRRAADAAARSAEEASNRRRDAAEAQRAAVTRSNEEAMARMEETQPTPTQAENDAAKLGIGDINDKEDHGGEDEGEALRRNMVGRLSSTPYETRSVDADAGREHYERRREGKAKGRAKASE